MINLEWNILNHWKMYEIPIHDNSIIFSPNYELKLIFEGDKLYHSH